MDLAQQYISKWSHLDQKALGWISDAKDIQQYILPSRGNIDGVDPQQRRSKKKSTRVITGVAGRALRVLGNTMYAGLSSPARPWFNFIPADPDLNDFKPVKNWLEETERRMMAMFAASNFYKLIGHIYKEQAAFCLSGFAIEELIENFPSPGDTEHPRKLELFRMIKFPLGQFRVAASKGDRVDTIYREMWEPAISIYNRFPHSRLPDELIKKAKGEGDRNPWDTYKILHVYEPRDVPPVEGIVSTDRMPHSSDYVLLDTDAASHGTHQLSASGSLLEEGGYPEPALFVGRWESDGEDDYGMCPALDVLPDVKMLQAMERDGIKAINLSVDRPTVFPKSMKNRLANRAITAGMKVFEGAGQKVARALYDNDPRVDWLEARIQRVTEEIRDGLYNDLFLMLIDNPNMTATEVIQRKQEKSESLAQIIENQFDEVLDPVIDRVFNIGTRAGVFSEAPNELKGMPLKTEYISPLAQLQKAVKTQALDATAAYTSAIVGIKPEAADVLSEDSIREYAEAVGAPPNTTLGPDEVDKIRQARAQALEEQKKLEQAAAAASAAKDLSSAEISDNNALGKLTEAMVGAPV